MQEELSTKLAIRDAKRDDVPQLVQLINALNLHEGGGETMTEQHADFMLFSSQRPVPLHCVVATSFRTVYGFVLFYQGYDTASTSFGFHIADIYVSVEHRSQGVGRILMREVARRCLEQGGQWCSLTALKNNQDAHQFYDALGMHSPDVTFRAIGPKGLASLATVK